MDLTSLLKVAVQKQASDIFLKVGIPINLRIGRKITPLGGPDLTEEHIKQILDQVLPERLKETFQARGEVDSAYAIKGVGRFRISLFYQQGLPGMVLRHVKDKVPSMEELGLPQEILEKIASEERGLVLVTGITGSGKSTTLAAMINFINHNFDKHIVTVEDPIEYTFEEDRCIFNQREIGRDTQSFSSALKVVVRQSPDVIMIGEMRDRETMEACFHAAETGHLVFSTLHTMNASQTVDRILLYLPPYLHGYYQKQMALLLKAVISQRLILGKKQTLVPAVEIMVNNPTMADLLEEGRTRAIYKAIKDGGHFGCQTFNQALKNMIEEGAIDLEEAIKSSDAPDELKMEVRGIVRGKNMKY